jgi:hypothetical protein
MPLPEVKIGRILLHPADGKKPYRAPFIFLKILMKKYINFFAQCVESEKSSCFTTKNSERKNMIFKTKTPITNL